MTPDEARALFNEHREPGDMAHYGEKAAVAAILASVDERPMRKVVAAVINEMSRQMPSTTEDWRARLTEALV